MLTLQLAEEIRPLGSPRVIQSFRALWAQMKRLTGTRVALEGIEHFPTSPAILACNSTHKMDWFFFQELFMNLGLRAPIISKGKNWHEPMARFGCQFLDALPMVSRGYILSVDLKEVLRERPDEALYRAVREHLDRDAALDEGDPRVEAILDTPRDILGARFDPRQGSYRTFIEMLYFRFQNEHLLRMSREMVRQKHHIHIYPQGTVSSRLSRGRVGAVELAIALDVPIVPMGLSGAPEVFLSDSLPLLRGGVVTLRIGEPMTAQELMDASPQSALLEPIPETFRPFHPRDERQHHDTLQAMTDVLMDQINDLLDPPYQWASSKESDGKQGVKRFI